MSKRKVLLCTNCGRETANWKEFDGHTFCDTACILQHVLERSEEYRERFLLPNTSIGVESDPVGERILRRSMQTEIERTTKTMETYVDNPTSCPYCDSSNIDYVESLPPSISVKCFDCGESWVEVWELVGVDDVIVYETVPFVPDTESGIDHYE